MAFTPMIGADGLPMLGGDGKPMLCEADRYCCGSPGCAASFTSENLGGNQWRFTDTSPGAHTRQWASEDGGSSTASPWVHTFPTARLYWVDLTVTYPGLIVCTTRKYIGDFIPCDFCSPSDLGETVYLTIGPGGNDGSAICTQLTPTIPGTYAATSKGSPCSWGNDFYAKGTCYNCSSPLLGPNRSHIVNVRASMTFDGPFGRPTAVHFVAEASYGPSSSSTDCNGYSGGGSARYRKIIPVGPPLYRTPCIGTHTLNKESESLGPKYFKFPDTVILAIPGP